MGGLRDINRIYICMNIHNNYYIHTYEICMKKSGGPEQKGILRTAVSSLLDQRSPAQSYSGIHTGLYTQGFPK